MGIKANPVPAGEKMDVVDARSFGRPEALVNRLRVLLYAISIALLVGGELGVLGIVDIGRGERLACSAALAALAVAWTIRVLRARVVWRDVFVDAFLLTVLVTSAGQMSSIGGVFYAAVVFRSTYRGRPITIVRPIIYAVTYLMAGYFGTSLHGNSYPISRLIPEALVLLVTAVLVTAIGKIADAHQLARQHESTLLTFATDIAGENDLDRIVRVGVATVSEITRYATSRPAEVLFGANVGKAIVIRSGRGRRANLAVADLARPEDFASPLMTSEEMAERSAEILIGAGQDLIYCGGAGQMRKTAFPIGSPGDWRGMILVLTCEELPEISKSSISMVASELQLALAEIELVGSLRASEAERAKLLEKLVNATEEERTRIAGDLHDGPIQTLAALAFDLDFGISLVEAEEDAAAVDALRTARLMLTGEVDHLRQVMTDLLPPTLTERGVGLAIRDLVGKLAERHPETRMTFCGDSATRLAEPLERTLYRLTGEALANCFKHADATNVTVDLTVTGTTAKLTIADDGVGFDSESAQEHIPAGHFGLASMRQRAEMIGGSIDISSLPGFGTTVRVAVPLVEMAQGRPEAHHG